MKKLLLLFLAFPLFLSGCQLRNPLYELAIRSPDDVPRIIVIDPADKLYDVPCNALIGLLFSKPMDQQSLEDSFEYSYNGATYDTSDGSFIWDAASRLAIFTPDSYFPPSTEISVTVGIYVKSKQGLNLEEGASWQFETSTLVDLGSFYNITNDWASHETTMSGIHTLDAQIILEFDKEMLRSSVEGSFQLVSDDFQDIRTANDGFFLWSEPMLGVKRAIFTPDKPLLPSKSYQIYLNANGIQAIDIAGNSYNGVMLAPLFQFQTIDAIYVSTTGDDSNEGYLSNIPVKTISRALERALEYGLTFIRIEEGTYNENIILSGPTYNGFILQGGWDIGFLNYDSDPLVYQTTIETVSRNYVFTLSGSTGVTLDTLFVLGPVTAPPDINGAVLIDGGSSDIRIDNCYLVGSDGAEEGHGARITGNSNNVSVAWSHVYGANVPTTNRSYGISVDNAQDIYIYDNIEIWGGGAALHNSAIHIAGSSDTVNIERNLINGGWEGELYGIYAGGGSQNILVQDNSSINGGTTTNNNTTGILVENGASANIYKNTILGGEETGSAAVHIGVGFSAAGDCNLFNNFIVGGAATTETQNNSYGVYVADSDVNIINNTINGLGNAGAPGITQGIYGENTDSNIINNIIIGGRGGTRYGITLSSYDTAVNDVLIYYNSFEIDGCLHGFLNDGIVPYTTIATMQSGYNNPGRMPTGNLDHALGDITFSDRNNGDYTVTGGVDLSSIQDNGYTLLSSILSIAELNDVAFDRFWINRPLSSMDRGGHEFSP